MPEADKPPEVQLAEVQDQIARNRRWAGPLLAPVWEVLARLAGIVATLIRRQGN